MKRAREIKKKERGQRSKENECALRALGVSSVGPVGPLSGPFHRAEVTLAVRRLSVLALDVRS